MNKLFTASIISVFFFAFAGVALASTTDGTISGYAWGNNLGWLNFGCDHCNAHITDTALTGYAWSQSYGWINLNPTHAGVLNNGEGTLSGDAWSEGVGWIDFTGVTVNSSGVFGGTATPDAGGSVNFSCDHCGMQTDWRPASSRSSGGGGGGGGGGSGGNSAAAAAAAAGSNNANPSQSPSPTPTPSPAPSSSPQPPSSPTPTPVVPDTTPPNLKITSIKSNYNADEKVVLGGTTEANASLTFSFDGQYGLSKADKKGNWLVDFGMLSPGTHSITITARDVAGNTTKVEASLTVNPPQPQSPDTIFNNPLFNSIKSFINMHFFFLKPLPVPVVTVQKPVPLVFTSNWNFLNLFKKFTIK